MEHWSPHSTTKVLRLLLRVRSGKCRGSLEALFLDREDAGGVDWNCLWRAQIPGIGSHKDRSTEKIETYLPISFFNSGEMYRGCEGGCQLNQLPCRNTQSQGRK